MLRPTHAHKTTKVIDRRIHVTLVMALISVTTFAQCEDLKGDLEETKNWKAAYREYFNVDSTFQFIKADSVLIFYFSNSQNETTNGMSCCYFLADRYARTELAKKLAILYKKLDKEDSKNFRKAQQAWQAFYDREWEFLRHAFISYSNYWKYGLGLEVMIETQSRKYQMMKDRVLMVDRYIKTVAQDQPE